MKKNLTKVIIIILVLIIAGAGIAIKLKSFKQVQIGCIETKAKKEWSMHYDKLGGKYKHKFKLDSDKNLLILDVVTRSGDLSVYVDDENDRKMNAQHVSTGTHYIEVQGKKINVRVEAKEHVGEFSIKAQEKSKKNKK